MASGARPDLLNYSSMIHAHAKTGDLSAAKLYFERAESQNIGLDVMCYNMLLNACAKKGAPAAAAELFARAEQRGLK